MKIIDVEQNTDAWLEARKGKITGSKLNDIVVKRGSGRKIGFYQLLADRLAIVEEVEDVMERGHRLEGEAIAKFSEITGKKVDSVGICVSDANENIAMSPDGLIKIGGKYKESVEVKCLSTARHLEAFFEKKIPAEYEFQVLQGFIVNEDLEKAYFVFYDPRVTSTPIFWIEVTRKERENDIEFYRMYQENTLKEIDDLLLKIAF